MLDAVAERLSLAAAGGESSDAADEACEPLDGAAMESADKGDASRRRRWLLPGKRAAVASLAGAALLALAALCGSRMRPEPLAAEQGALVTLDDAQANMATCIIDADQAVFYLLQAANFIRFSVDTCSGVLDVEAQAVCGASVTTVIASFGWVGAYAAAAVNSCGVQSNVPASCAASMSGFIAELGELGFIGSAIVSACDTSGFGFVGPPLAIAPEHDEEPKTIKEKLELIKKELPPPTEPEVEEANNLRGWSISQCVADLNIGITYVGRIGIQTYFLTKECPKEEIKFDRKKCALDVFNVLSSIAWAAQFLANAAVDCPEVPDSIGAACAGVVSDFVAVVMAMGPIVNGIADDCQPLYSGQEPGWADFA